MQCGALVYSVGFRHPAVLAKAVTAIDLLCNGTAWLVWSSPLPGNGRRVMRYINLMGGQKPHLLIETEPEPLPGHPLRRGDSIALVVASAPEVTP